MQATEKAKYSTSNMLGLRKKHIPSTAWSNMVATFQECNMHDLAEVLASPAKYALFQVLGNEFIRTLGSINIPTQDLSGSLVASASIGAFGGAVLTIIYTMLLIRSKRQKQVENLSTLPSLSSCIFQNLGKEVLYSALAAIMGTIIIGRNTSNDLRYLILAGSIGPVVALTLMLGAVGLVVVLVWGSSKMKGKLTG